MRRHSAIGTIGLCFTVFVGLSSFGGCSSNNSSAGPGGDASAGGSGSSSGASSSSGSSSSGGSSGSSGAAASSSSGSSSSGSAGGSSSGSSSGAGADASTPADAGSCVLPTAAQTCSHAPLHKSAIVDFSTYQADGTWGDSTTGDLTGGTSLFQGSGVTPLTLAVQGAAPDTALHVTGTVPMGQYAGFVLWFGPCVNATSVLDSGVVNTAMNFAIGGNLGGATLKFQVQTQDDYPVDVTNAKGGCLYPTCDKFSDCVSPTDTLTTLPATPTFTTFPWTSFVGGKPVATTTGDGLVGLQLQYECSTTTGDCAVDMTIGAIVLTGM